jgi:hypothetical protein
MRMTTTPLRRCRSNPTRTYAQHRGWVCEYLLSQLRDLRRMNQQVAALNPWYQGNEAARYLEKLVE